MTRWDAVVIGAGVSGLSTAIRLQEAGIGRVGILAAAPPDESTSNLAAAIWFPTHVGPRDRVTSWGQATYDEFADAATDPATGVVMRESLMLFREPPSTPWWAPAVGGVRPAPTEELPAGYRHGLRFVVPFAEMPRYLPWLLYRFTTAGGEIELRRLHDIADAATDAPIVVNCSGLAARSLVGDTSVVPVRGQIVIVANPGLTMSVRDEDHPLGRAYVHPRRDDCILGGTLEEGVWDTTVDAATATSIQRRCQDLVPALAYAPVLSHVVGLRPGRPSVRLEIDPHPPADTVLVHNYGHGGAGMTLSWGCADDVVRLLGRV